MYFKMNYNLYQHTPVYTIKELLYFCADNYGEKTAFTYKNKKQSVSVSFNDFKADVNAFGTYLFNKGLCNKHIAVFGENSYEWILTHFAVTCGGNVIVPIDKDLEIDNIAELLVDSESCVLVYSNTYSDIVEQLQEMLPNIIYINMKDISQHIETGKNLIVNGHTKYIDAKITKDNLASIVYTSGTTGKSKGVMLTHNNLCSCMYGACCNVKLSGSSLLILPLHHTFGLVAGVFSVLFYGYTIHINKSLKNLSKDFENSKPQNLFAVPLIVETLYKNIWLTARNNGKAKVLKSLILISNILRKCGVDLRNIFLKSVITAFGGNLDLIICGGAPLSPDLIKGFDNFGITVLNGYGITECGPIVAVNRNKCNVVGSVGLPLCCNEVKIADDVEILVKGDNVMLGYYNNEQENKKVFSDGWFKTGDLAKIDENGYLYITGRKKNLIILGNGENISAETIEQEIYTIPYVKECIAYGKDNIIVAEIYLDSEITNAKEMIESDIQKINNRLPQNKNIGKFILRETEFPKTTTKKIKRNYGGQ